MNEQRRDAISAMARVFSAVVRAKEAEVQGSRWPLPADLALHLYLYSEGLIPPTRPDPLDL